MQRAVAPAIEAGAKTIVFAPMDTAFSAIGRSTRMTGTGVRLLALSALPPIDEQVHNTTLAPSSIAAIILLWMRLVSSGKMPLSRASERKSSPTRWVTGISGAWSFDQGVECRNVNRRGVQEA